MEPLVTPAWKMINQAVLIKKFNFLPSFLTTLILTQILLDQAALTWVTIFHKTDAVFNWISNGSGVLTYAGIAVAVIVAFLLIEALVIVFEGGLLSLIRAFSQRDDSKYGYIRGLSAGLRTFLPLLEFDGFIKLFHPLVIGGAYLFLLRVIGFEFFWIVTVAVGLFSIIAVVVNILTSYARFYVVYEGMGLFPALSASTGMAIEHLGTTLRLFLGTLLLYIRIVLIVVVILVFPLLATALFTWLGSSIAFWVAIAGGSIVLLAFLAFVAHVNSVLEIFVTAMWYRAWEANTEGGVTSSHNSDLEDTSGVADSKNNVQAALA